MLVPSKFRIPRGSAVKGLLYVILLMIFAWVGWNLYGKTERTITFAAQGVSDEPLSPPTGKALPAEGGLRTIATDGDLTLEADLSRQLFVVQDRRNGLEWSSSPLEIGKEKGQLVSQMLSSPFTISYTKNGKDIQTTSLMSEQVNWEAYPIQGGVQVRYTIGNIGLSFASEIVLSKGGLKVSIPEQSVREGEAAQLTAIGIFPLFAAAKQGDEGYAVIPDGAGAITYFNRVHPNFEGVGYAKWIYGADPVFDPMQDLKIEQKIALPVYGMVKKHGGVIARATRGAADARLLFSPPGALNLDYYRSSVEFAYRKSYVAKISNNGKTATRVEKNRIVGDRELFIQFASGENISYVDLAQLLRQQYAAEWKRVPAAQNPILIRMLAGAESKQNTLLQKLIVTSTFDEMGQIAESLKRNAVSQFAVEVAGWYKNGLFSSVPGKFPADGRFGGNDGLKRLVQWGEKQQIPISLENNALDIYQGDQDGVRLRSDAVRQPNGELYLVHPILPNGACYSATDWHLLSPRIADQYRAKDMESFRRLGVTALDFTDFGGKLFSDYNPNQPLRRGDTMQFITRWLQVTKDQMKQAPGISTGFDFAAAEAGRVLNIPLDTSMHALLDESVPFMQTVYHGLVDYYSPPINRSSDPQKELLRAIEYGAIPSFELTFRSPTDLNLTFYDRLYSSQYEIWMPEVQRAYAMWREALQPVQSQPVTDHRKLDEAVYRVTYADGTTIWVNYGDKSYTSPEGIVVKPVSYELRKGGSLR